MKNLFEVTPAEYHAKLRCNRANVFAADSWLSKSVLWELNGASLYKWRHHPKQFTPTSAMQWGTLVDCLTTTPELEETELAFCEFDNFRTKDAQEWRDNALAAGKIIVTTCQLAEGRKAAEMLLHTCRRSAEIFERSKSQVIVGGKIMGANVKGLIDLAPEGDEFLADLKTTSNFSLDGFSKTISDFGYHVQAGLYLWLWNAMFPHDQRMRFKLIWQDSEAPYEVAVTELHADEIAHGQAYAIHLLRRITDAASANHWPTDYDDAEPVLLRPTWAAMREEEKVGMTSDLDRKPATLSPTPSDLI